MEIAIKDGRGELYQWDTGRAITLSKRCEQVHFKNLDTVKNTYDVDVEEINGEFIAKIPDELLQSAHNIWVYTYDRDVDGNLTTLSTTLSVIKRKKPAGYVYTPTEQKSIEYVIGIAEDIQRRADNGEFDGEDGHTPEKGVDYWTEEDKEEIVSDVFEKLPETSGGIEDAPSDNTLYGRKNGAWVEVVSTGDDTYITMADLDKFVYKDGWGPILVPDIMEGVYKLKNIYTVEDYENGNSYYTDYVIVVAGYREINGPPHFYQTQYTQDGTVLTREFRLTIDTKWSEWKQIHSTPVANTVRSFVNILGGTDNWTAEDVFDSNNNIIGVRYGQIVNVNNAVITPNSKVDLQISSEQMVIFYEKDLAFVAENEDGVVTVYCIGNIPENSYTLQATVTEVVING